MGLIAEQSHLTVTDRSLETKRQQTFPGMAHFAKSGPEGFTCRQCVSWTGCGGESGYYAKKGMYGGMIKPRSCHQYKTLMQGDIGPGVPHTAGACKYFSENRSPPPIVKLAG